MRRNLFVVVLIPCILACVLLVLIIMDKQHDAKKAAYKATESSETSDMINSTESEITVSTTTDAPITTTTESQTTISTTKPTSASTQTITTAPTTKQSSVVTTESKQGVTSVTTKDTETNKMETEPTATHDEYEALKTQKGETYTLIADKNSKHFIFINNQDNTVRETEFTYHPKYEQYPGEFNDPIFGYKNEVFVFIAENKIVASDGSSETIIVTLDNSNLSDDIHINPLIQSDNRFMVGIEGTLFVIDCRTLIVEKYTEDYSVDFFVFTDDYFCFSSRRRIPAGPYYNYIYVAQNGEARLLGSIGEIDEYVLDSDVIYIQSQDMLFQVNLKTIELTSSNQLDRERTLYFPVYGSCIIQNLFEIRYINYNDDQKPEQTIKLPEFLKAECYYGSPYAKITYSLNFNDVEKASTLPTSGFGSFALIDCTEYPLKDDKFIMHSTVKEKLYSGKTALGEGEIFLLERIETKNNNSIPFEMIYAWIPVKGESSAYQFYIYVPEGDTAGVWLNMLKQLLQAD